MANIRLKELVEANVDPKLVARSKESGKLVYFKTPQAKDAAVKAGSHLEPKAKKGGEPKADVKPNDMFGADYKKDRGAEAPKADTTKATSPKADVKSIIKGLLKTADKEFGHAWDLKDSSVEIIDYIYDEDEDGKELKARLEAGEDGTYVQTDEMEGTIVFNDGSQYQAVGDMMGDVNITKVRKDEPKADTPKVNLPKKASELDDTHAESLEKAINAEVGLNGFVDTDDYTDAIIYTASTGNQPTYTLYFGSNSDYGKPDEFRVTFASTAIDNDPSNIGNTIDKPFKSAKDAMKYMIAVAKKYKKELEMDDDTNESTKLTSMFKK